MRLLVLDCAANACAAAVLEDDRDLAAVTEAMTRGHAERIAPMVAECLAAAGADADSLDAVAVTIGPGAFTGIRIGLAAARGFALAAGIPVLGVSCLDVAAAPFRNRSPVLVALETKRADFYLQAFAADGAPVTAPAALAAADLARYLPDAEPREWAVTGDGAARLAAASEATGLKLSVTPSPAANSAVTAGRIALARIAAEGMPAAGDPGPRPLYLRPPDVNPNPPVSPLGRRKPVGTGPAGHGR